MNFRKLCQDYHIPTAPSQHKHYRRGWVNVACPFCTGNPGYHLGYEQDGHGTGFVCYRCGGKGGVKTIAALCHVSTEEAKAIIEEYGGRAYTFRVKKWKDWELDSDVDEPSGAMELSGRGAKYLTERGFDAEVLQKLWDVKQFGPTGKYKFRIYIPIKFQGHTISYTCRSYVGCETRYLSCPSALEKIPHKQILYGIDEVPNNKRIVVVEGCTDVWRLGPGAVATFGTKFTHSQIKLLSKFRKIVLLRDMDAAGATAWGKLEKTILALGLDVSVVALDGVGDAAELSQIDANHLMKIL